MWESFGSAGVAVSAISGSGMVRCLAKEGVWQRVWIGECDIVFVCV